jgi:hypothetical protein
MDKLTPGQISDLSDLFACYDRYSADTMRPIGWVHWLREEAARRELDAQDDEVVASIKRGREGRGSAADDLVERLRQAMPEMPTHERAMEEAADRIESDVRTIFRRTEQLVRVEVERDALKARVARLAEALGLVLPLAKGYVAKYDYASSREYIAVAESAIAEATDAQG